MDNTLSIFGTIDRSVNASVKHCLGDVDPGSSLLVKIDSEGGSVFDGLSIYSALQAYGGEKECVIESAAMSIASYIAMAFDRVKITSNGYLMIHNPSMRAEGDDEQLSKDAGLLAKLKASMIDAYSSKTKIAPTAIEKMMRDETYLNAEEALAAGFVDEIVDYATPSRVVTAKSKEAMPFRVVAALGGASDSGEQPEEHKEAPVSDSQPVAMTVKQIKAKYPKASSDFIVKAMEEEMTEDQVAEQLVEELTAENEELKAKVSAMEEEQVAKAESDEEEVVAEEEEEEQPAAKVAAKSGAKPVAHVAGGRQTKSAKSMWQDAVSKATAEGLARPQAVAKANRDNPGLRQRMLDEINS